MKILDVLREDKFDGVVYYFESNGFSLISELDNFDFELLFFVPGVNENTALEAINLCTQAIKQSKNIEVNPTEELIVPENGSGEIAPIDGPSDDVPLATVLETTISLIKKIESEYSNKRALKKRAQELARFVVSEKQETFSIVCDALCEHIVTAGFSPEQIQLLKEMSISDFFANLMNGNRRCGGVLINHCFALGKRTMWDLMDFDFDAKCVRGASEASMQICKDAYEQFLLDVKAGKFYKKEPTAMDYLFDFLEKWNSLNENTRCCVINSGRGKTLQYSADELGITRERVRQIILKACRSLRIYAIPLADALLKENSGEFTDDDARQFFNDDTASTAFLFVVRETDACIHIGFAQKYFSNEFPEDYEKTLDSIAKKYIGDGTNFFECMDEIESVLIKEGLSQLDFYDFLSYLLNRGYKLYGDFVARKRNAYALICYDVVTRYFKNGIKFDISNECKDLIRLREIVKKRYGNYELPDNDRSLATRIASMLVLCDKSTYCVPENIQYSEELLNEIIDSFNASSETFVFYSDLFKRFQGRLLMETNITNHYALHGILRYLYPDDFQYDRDKISKIGSKFISLEQQLTELLLRTGAAMTRDEIAKSCPCATGLRLANAAFRDPGIIVWNYNEYNHINNIVINDHQKAMLENILDSITSGNAGYCNERQLLPVVQMALPEFVIDNKITDGLNIFYIAEVFFKHKFRFSRPHIVSKLFPKDLALTNFNVGKYFIGQRDTFSHADFLKIANQCAWSHSMISGFLIELESEYIRINENEYLLKDKFKLDDTQIADVTNAVLQSMNGGEYVALFATFAIGKYPSIGYEWNEFLLESIVRNYIPSLKIIEPILRDRRYKRGIIVKSTNPCATYEELVVHTMENDNFTSMSIDLFDDYLRNAGLLLNNIPQEILDSSSLSIKDGFVRLL